MNQFKNQFRIQAIARQQLQCKLLIKAVFIMYFSLIISQFIIKKIYTTCSKLGDESLI